MYIGWPQAIYLVIVVLGLGVAISRHGQPVKPSVYNAWGAVIATALILALLWWGGFFN